MTSVVVTLTNSLGLHARAAARFVQTASRFESQIRVQSGSRTVDGKSILGLLLLVASRRTDMTLTADGRDEVDAIEALADLVRSGLGDAP